MLAGVTGVAVTERDFVLLGIVMLNSVAYGFVIALGVVAKLVPISSFTVGAAAKDNIR